MVQRQLCSLEQLRISEFGRPFPRHGLQLLFWFANHCVTCEVINFVLIMKLVSNCQPERGIYGFHLFGNMEELLPVLNRKCKSKRQVLYFEVGNLNTDTYPASANLPTYVRENYVLEDKIGDINLDRIIVSYQLRTRVVERVYVTEHDRAAFGGYWGDIQVVQANDIEEIYYPEPSAQQMFNIMQNYSGSTARAERRGLSTYVDSVKKKKEGGGVNFVKILLSAGMLYLAAKCFGWLRSWWRLGPDENTLRKMLSHHHVMLDYVY
ncbi:Chitin synthase 3 [Dissostichus eleginoides]|uniref:Chitin synthase 3 n=1 Tax=Dissostichus eleginoides TaxID=100907 RepID=A0AAD9F1U3_DISEL|nr:Chitin synthase 3 [Dissostichus eleginoides]